MARTDYLSRFLVRFDPHVKRRVPGGEVWAVLLVVAGAVSAIASFAPLAMVGGFIVLIGLAIGCSLREEADAIPGRDLDRLLVENFCEVRLDEARGDLGITWNEDAVGALEKCAQAWAMVNRSLARRFWKYRTLTKTWRNLWVDVHWAADCAMLEALWAARRTSVFAGSGRTRNDAMVQLRQLTGELVNLAFQLSQDAFPRPVERSAVREVIDEIELAKCAREELDRDVPTFAM